MSNPNDLRGSDTGAPKEHEFPQGIDSARKGTDSARKEIDSRGELHDIAVRVIDSSPAGIAATIAATITVPNDQEEVSVRPSQDVINAKQRTYRQSFWWEKVLTNASIGLFVSGSIVVFISTSVSYEEDWIHSAYGKATGALAFANLLTLYGKQVASRRIRDVGKWLKRYEPNADLVY